MNKNKRKLGAVVALAVVLAMAGTFAYFNQTLTAENPFDTGKYDSVMTEDFNPSDGNKWEPGATVNKDVAVDNTGDYPLVVRVKFDEKWTKKGGTAAYKTNTGLQAGTSQDNATDGLVATDGSVVEKTLNDAGWTYNPADGYWYYKKVLKAGESTGTFLDAVKLIEGADMGKYDVKKYYTTMDTAPSKTDANAITGDPTTGWAIYTGEVPANAKHNMTKSVIDPNAGGYADSNYVLTITAQTVQATKAAAEEAFGAGNVLTDWNLK